METILLDIKPEYVERIFNGEKLYEYRKRLSQKDINKIIVYATHPTMKVIGEVEVINVIRVVRLPFGNKLRKVPE